MKNYIWLISSIIFFIYIFTRGMSDILDYHLNENGIQFIFLRIFKIAQIRYCDIKDCHISHIYSLSGIDLRHPCNFFRVLNLTGWPRFRRVVIRKKYGFFIYVIIYPREPLQMHNEIIAKISEFTEQKKLQ